MWRLLYTAAIVAAMPFVLARLWWRGRREPLYRRHVGERFSEYRDAPSVKPVLWIHAVSVGEARASANLVRALAAAHPECELLLTCMTAAGRETLVELHGVDAHVVWLPYDYPGAVRRFMEHFRPRLALLVETEIWPNLVAACAEWGVPILLANARMSEKSALGYQRWAGLLQPAIAALTVACAQSESDVARLRALGARRVEVSGNLKFDSTPDEAKRGAGRAWRAQLARPVLLLASTREGEEKMLLEALPAWDEKLLVIVVPRHPRRFDEVAVFSQSRRSRNAVPAPGDQIHLGDSMGEMDFYYAAADAAIIGGSFAPLGGQNLIEACAAGVPVVFGPSMFNFAEAARLALEAKAAIRADDASGAVREALRLLSDPAERERMGAAGAQIRASHRSATKKHLRVCEELLKTAVTVQARD